MAREDRRLTNIKQDAITEINYYPSKQSVPEGELTIATPKGKPARLYKKLKGMLWWSNFTQDGNQYVDKNLNVDNDLIYKGYLRNSNYPAFSAYPSTDEDGTEATIATSTNTRVNFDLEDYDIGGNYDTSAYKFTAPVAGIYHFDARILWDGNVDPTDGDWTAGERHDAWFVKNADGTNPSSSNRVAADIDIVSGTISDTVLMNNLSADLKLDAGDYITVAVWQNSGTNQYIYEPAGSSLWSNFTGHLITAI